MRDLRDLFRSNHLVALAEAATGEEVPGKVNAAMPHEHETNFEAVVKFVGARTRIEWGEAKMIGGLKGKVRIERVLIDHTSQFLVVANGIPGDYVLASR